MQFVFTKSAQKQFLKLSKLDRKRVGDKILWFFTQEDPLIFATALRDHRLGDFRFRIGDFRVIFDVEGDQAIVLCVGHRRDIYD